MSPSSMAFAHHTKNTTVLKNTLTSPFQSLDSSTTSYLKKKKMMIPLEIDKETKARTKIRSLKMKSIGNHVSYSGINVTVPKSKGKPSTTASSNVS